MPRPPNSPDESDPAVRSHLSRARAARRRLALEQTRVDTLRAQWQDEALWLVTAGGFSFDGLAQRLGVEKWVVQEAVEKARERRG